MATSLRSRIQEDHLSCSICFNRFTTPKALPCVHTFCLSCLEEHVTYQLRQSATPSQTFPCPICRQETPIPSTGVSGFADNHMIASLLDTLEESSGTDSPRVPPRPAPSVIEAAKDRISPVPETLPVVPPRPKSYSPTPKRAKNASPIPQSLSQDAFPKGRSPSSGFGQIITGGIVALEGAVGGISTAISDFSSHLYPQKPIEKKDTPMLPFEFVETEDITGPAPQTSGLYPEIPQPVGPCMKGVVLTFGKYGPSVDNFLRPFGMSVGLNGEFVVSDLKGNRVFVFNNEGKMKYRFNIECGVKDVAVTNDNQILMAVTGSGKSIMRLYTMEGRCLQMYGDFFRYDDPSGIAVSRSNHAVVTNLAANNVLVFTEQRKYSTKFGSKGGGEKHFNAPSFVTTTSKDYIIVSDTGNNCVKIFDNHGNFKRMFGSYGNSRGQLSAPLGVCMDANDFIIVADSNNFRVEIYTVKGTYNSTLVRDTNQIGPDVKPINVAVTPRNNVAVLLYGTGFAEVRVYNWQPSTACKTGFSNV